MTRGRQAGPYAIGLVLAAFATCYAAGESDDAYLVGDALRSVFVGATLIGTNWAEYYEPDGVIVGKVRYLGIVRDFSGRWSVKRDQVCFEYELRQYDTCSKFRLVGDRLRHFGADGRPKPDGESRRLSGNHLDAFP